MVGFAGIDSSDTEVVSEEDESLPHAASPIKLVAHNAASATRFIDVFMLLSLFHLGEFGDRGPLIGRPCQMAIHRRRLLWNQRCSNCHRV